MLRVRVDWSRGVVGTPRRQGEVGHRWSQESLLLRDLGKALLWGRSNRSSGAGASSKPLAVLDHPSQLWQGHAFLRVQVENNAQDALELGRDRKDGSQELGVLSECSESRVTCASLLPGITTTCQVHKNDSQTPDIVAGSVVTFT